MRWHNHGCTVGKIVGLAYLCGIFTLMGVVYKLHEIKNEELSPNG